MDKEYNSNIFRTYKLDYFGKYHFYEENDYNVDINGEVVHLDLIYKMDIKKLEDHYRITTRISEKGDTVSCLLYIDLENGEDFINGLNHVKEAQIELSRPKD